MSLLADLRRGYDGASGLPQVSPLPPGWLSAVLAHELRWRGAERWPRPEPGRWPVDASGRWPGAWGPGGLPEAISASGRLLPHARR